MEDETYCTTEFPTCTYEAIAHVAVLAFTLVSKFSRRGVYVNTSAIQLVTFIGHTAFVEV